MDSDDVTALQQSNTYSQIQRQKNNHSSFDKLIFFENQHYLLVGYLLFTVEIQNIHLFDMFKTNKISLRKLVDYLQIPAA